MTSESLSADADLAELLKLWRRKSENLSKLFQAARLEPADRRKLEDLRCELRSISELLLLLNDRIDDALEA